MDDIRIQPSLPLPGAPGAGAAGPAGSAATGFVGTLKDAIAKVNEVQVEATQAVEKLATGESQNVHQTMIALQKADVSFQLMMQLRNKIVTAYEEIQRMQI
ncbi:MAG: flagellar hook-basal body complex protein FliE [Nitrospirota bacterium]|nr:flagellar hook-basal body complex protein FliE [Nitrospirota bacterium]